MIPMAPSSKLIYMRRKTARFALHGQYTIHVAESVFLERAFVRAFINIKCVRAHAALMNILSAHGEQKLICPAASCNHSNLSQKTLLSQTFFFTVLLLMIPTNRIILVIFFFIASYLFHLSYQPVVWKRIISKNTQRM